MKNWNDVTLPITERKELILRWAKRKGIPETKANSIANKKLNITAYETDVFKLLDELDDAICCINTDDHDEYINLYDENHYIKEMLGSIADKLREILKKGGKA